ncbi:hypothetical protein FRB97_004268 [Tulasnella sp. 331]|nr:hypothetical protein FRB97_004268 [Tulasnella sp. 331]KAG8884016.1 hypothetical protein FRB98_002657 [Tulasnella sp. 332]
MVQNRSKTPLPALQKTSPDVLDGPGDAFRRTLDVNHAFSGLGEHVLGSDYTDTTGFLDLLDLETSAADDGSHEVVREARVGFALLGSVAGELMSGQNKSAKRQVSKWHKWTVK